LLKYGIRTIVPIEEIELLGGKKAEKEYAVKYCNSLISIPCYPSLSDKDVEYIITKIKQVKYL